MHLTLQKDWRNIAHHYIGWTAEIDTVHPHNRLWFIIVLQYGLYHVGKITAVVELSFTAILLHLRLPLYPWRMLISVDYLLGG